MLWISLFYGIFIVGRLPVSRYHVQCILTTATSNEHFMKIYCLNGYAFEWFLMMFLQLIFKINFTRAHFSDFVFLFFFFRKNISSLVFRKKFASEAKVICKKRVWIFNSTRGNVSTLNGETRTGIKWNQPPKGFCHGCADDVF